MGATSQGGKDNPGVVQRHERRRRLGYSDRSTMESTLPARQRRLFVGEQTRGTDPLPGRALVAHQPEQRDDGNQDASHQRRD